MKFFPNISEEDRLIIQRLNLKKPYVWLATWFGAGFLRPAPGTWGTLAAMPFGIALLLYGNIYILMAAILAATIGGIWASKFFELATGIHDSKMIVIDEVVGIWITLIPICLMLTPGNDNYAIILALGFIFFRIFDITKPWPASYFDKKIKNAYGVMGDDIIAGLYAAIALTGVIFYAGFS